MGKPDDFFFFFFLILGPTSDRSAHSQFMLGEPDGPVPFPYPAAGLYRTDLIGKGQFMKGLDWTALARYGRRRPLMCWRRLGRRGISCFEAPVRPFRISAVVGRCWIKPVVCSGCAVASDYYSSGPVYWYGARPQGFNILSTMVQRQLIGQMGPDAAA